MEPSGKPMAVDAFARMKEENAIALIMASLDLGHKDLLEMDNIVNDDLDLLQFNGREFLRESINLLEGLVWACSGRNVQVAALCARAMAERWKAWEGVVDSDNPHEAIQKSALYSMKRLRNQVVGRPGYEQAVNDMDDVAHAATGQILAEVGRSPAMKVGTTADDNDTVGYSIASGICHANFTLLTDAVSFDQLPGFWLSVTHESYGFFMALLHSVGFTVTGEHGGLRIGRWENPHRWLADDELVLLSIAIDDLE